MRIILIFLFAISLIASPIAFADMEAIYFEDRAIGQNGWSVHGLDDDLSNAATLVTELDTTYAQLAAEDNIEILSAEAADTTQTVTVYGINSDGNRVSEVISLNGTTVVASSATFRYIDQVKVNAECTGVITVRRATGDTFIISIPVGSLNATVVQHFNGEKASYITGWWASNTSTTAVLTLSLRWYQDDSDCLDPTDGFRVLDTIYIDDAVTSPYSPAPRIFPQPIYCPAGGWLAVYVIGDADNGDCAVTIQGFDTR